MKVTRETLERSRTYQEGEDSVHITLSRPDGDPLASATDELLWQSIDKAVKDCYLNTSVANTGEIKTRAFVPRSFEMGSVEYLLHVTVDHHAGADVARQMAVDILNKVAPR